ncbi:hypothetical protein BT63DRAFT_467628 [Microthyrium microscopicum]|uniref:Rhodopsin domain-containing protein n=1 Tax=Microthyrium microscopicum TaxID=703497 RepID=A0A6A6UH91_9PEZI|nr:hypothetical protein BT63DRAFT_467628 [Microthyrium microscopicum]
MNGLAHDAFARHVWSVQPQAFARGIRDVFIAENLYVFATCVIKLSFASTLLRISNVKAEIYAIYAVAGLAISITIVYFTTLMINCHPIHFFWTRLLGDTSGHCLDVEVLIKTRYAHGVSVATCDMALAIIPTIMVSRLQMRRKQKVSISILLAIGSIASIATIARIPYIHKMRAQDFLYDNMPICMWTIVEVGVSLIATAAGTFKPLVSSWMSTTNNNSKQTPNGSKLTPNHSRQATQSVVSKAQSSEYQSSV